MGKAPAFQFYPKDWTSDTGMLSLAARGAWIDLLCAMWNSQTRGVLSLTWVGYARILGVSVDQAKTAISELIDMQICDFETDEPLHVTECNGEKKLHFVTCNGNVTLKNRRMYRERKSNDNSALRVRRHRMKYKCNGNVTPPSSSSSSTALKKEQPPLPPLSAKKPADPLRGTGGDVCVVLPAAGEGTTPPSPLDRGEKDRAVAEEYAFAAQVIRDLEAAHPGVVQESRVLIEQAYHVITTLRAEGKTLAVLRAAHEWALSDVRENAGNGWKGWQARYLNAGNWLKQSSSGVRWVDIWIESSSAPADPLRGKAAKKAHCRGCGQEAERLNFEMLCGACQAKEAMELERLRMDPGHQKKAKQAMDSIWETLGAAGKIKAKQPPISPLTGGQIQGKTE